MSKAIASLLDLPEQLVAKTLAKLEDKNGYPSHDVRHLASTIQNTRQKIAELGLDPSDTTAQELYHALLIKFDKDSQAFEISQGFSSKDFGDKANRAIDLINANLTLPERWVLKNSAAKAILKQHTPKKLMKQLGYRSADSLLKRENIGKLFIMANIEESQTWQKELARAVSHQDSACFELRGLNLVSLTDIKTTGSALQYNDDIGTLALLDAPPANQMPLLSIVVLLIDGLKEFGELNLADQLGKISPLLSWWSDMDGLITKLNDEPVSLSIKDASLNHAHDRDFSDRTQEHGRSNFWQQLISRYENQLAIQEDTLISFERKIMPTKLPLRQPVFEYVGDF